MPAATGRRTPPPGDVLRVVGRVVPAAGDVDSLAFVVELVREVQLRLAVLRVTGSEVEPRDIVVDGGVRPPEGVGATRRRERLAVDALVDGKRVRPRRTVPGPESVCAGGSEVTEVRLSDGVAGGVVVDFGPQFAALDYRTAVDVDDVERLRGGPDDGDLLVGRTVADLVDETSLPTVVGSVAVGSGVSVGVAVSVGGLGFGGRAASPVVRTRTPGEGRDSSQTRGEIRAPGGKRLPLVGHTTPFPNVRKSIVPKGYWSVPDTPAVLRLRTADLVSETAAASGGFSASDERSVRTTVPCSRQICR